MEEERDKSGRGRRIERQKEENPEMKRVKTQIKELEKEQRRKKGKVEELEKWE